MFNFQRSCWEMLGYVGSYRDDFQRTMQIVGMMIHGSGPYGERMEQVRVATVEWAGANLKKTGDLVSFPLRDHKVKNILLLTQDDSLNANPSCSRESVRTILDSLQRDLELVASELDTNHYCVYTIPNYPAIIERLRQYAIMVDEC
jgi:hypothetical protein